MLNQPYNNGHGQICITAFSRSYPDIYETGLKTLILFSTPETELNATGIYIFSSPGRSPGRAIVLPPVSALASALALASTLVSASALAKCLSFYDKVFYVMGKVLAGELSSPCDRSCSMFNLP